MLRQKLFFNEAVRKSMIFWEGGREQDIVKSLYCFREREHWDFPYCYYSAWSSSIFYHGDLHDNKNKTNCCKSKPLSIWSDAFGPRLFPLCQQHHFLLLWYTFPKFWGKHCKTNELLHIFSSIIHNKNVIFTQSHFTSLPQKGKESWQHITSREHKDNLQSDF